MVVGRSYFIQVIVGTLLDDRKNDLIEKAYGTDEDLREIY